MIRFRRQYVNDPAFQLRYGIWLSGIGLFCFIFTGFLVYVSVYHELENTLASTVPREVLEAATRPQYMFMHFEVVIPVMIMMIFLFCIGIVSTHRIAGPLFAMKRHLTRLRKGTIRGPLKLRGSDQLQDLAYALNALIDQFNGREAESQKLLEQLERDLEENKIASAINKLKKFKKEAVN